MSTLQTYNLKHPDASGNQITFTSGGDINFDSGAVYIDSAGSVGIGTTSASNQGANFNNLVVGNTSGNNGITVLTGSNNDGIINFNNADDSHLTGYLIYEHSTDSLRFGTAGTGDKMRIGSSGRLLLGGSSSTKNYKLVVRNNAGNDGFEGGIFLQRASTPPNGGGHGLGTIVFGAAPTGDENEAAQISAKSDGDWGVNDWPSRLEFYTTPDGSNVMMERMRITSAGRLGLGLGNISPAAKLDVNGNQTSNVVAMAALDVDCSAGNYFTKTINGNSTFTFSNVPSSRSFSFVLELTHTSGTVTWPSSVKFPGDTAPTLTAGKTHLFVFETNDGGTRFRGAALVDYVN
tara:strand:- start:21 stop:1061 length:1041 start_codon:yes stop_codon:yes gene_type:complete